MTLDQKITVRGLLARKMETPANSTARALCFWWGVCYGNNIMRAVKYIPRTPRPHRYRKTLPI